MRRVIEEIEDYIGTKEIIVSLLLTAVFLFMSFVGHTAIAPTQITVRSTQVDVFTTFYGSPFYMVGILTPVTSWQRLQVDRYTEVEGHGRFQILWDGLMLNSIVFFLLAFFISYLLKRVSSR